jgi:hypothetical protein
MDEDVRAIVRTAILTIIDQTISDRNIEKSVALHKEKIHFIPPQYRVLGGLLQSLNIKFGNFIEKLIALVVDYDSKVSALPESGRKIPLSMTAETDSLIDEYITSRQLPDSPDRCDEVFQDLLTQILSIERDSPAPKQTITKDVDALFRIGSKQSVYVEIKYNDDHDTGKFVDINRKFIKTYAGLINRLDITDIHALRPVLYYLNPVKRYGPIYVPSSNIYRGAQLFDQYFEIPFGEIDRHLRMLGSDEEIVAVFDNLYERVRHDYV